MQVLPHLVVPAYCPHLTMLTALSVLPLTWVALVAAQSDQNVTLVDTNTQLQLQVASGGGNATSPYQYGIMYEVSKLL